MIANYALATEASTILSTSWSLIAGDKDGAVTMLAIVDPRYQKIFKKNFYNNQFLVTKRRLRS